MPDPVKQSPSTAEPVPVPESPLSSPRRAAIRLRLLQMARRLNRWSGLLGLFLGIAALVAGVAIGVWSVRKSEEIARRSGSFDKPKLALFLGNWKLAPNASETLKVGAAFEPRSVTLLQIPLRIANEGPHTAHDVTLLLRLPEAIRSGVGDFLTRKIARFDPGLQFNEASEKLGHFEFRSYNLSRINPGSMMAINEVIVLSKETSLRVPVPNVGFVVDVTYGFTVDITLEQENETPQRYSLEISSVKVANEDQLVKVITRDINRTLDELRRKTSFREYIAELIASRTDHEYVALVTPANKVSVADSSLVTASPLEDSIGRVDYGRASWRRLFVKPSSG